MMKDEWLTALRSGKYKQGYGHLRVNDTYCCLGVLCDVMGAKWEKRADPSYNAIIDGQRYHSSAGLPFPPNMLSSKAQIELIRMNDLHESSFDDIANWIEENL